MEFVVKPKISSADSLAAFFEAAGVGKGDLILTNEYVLMPALGGQQPPCDVLYQEKYGVGEPSDEMVDGILDAIRGKGYTRIIAIGGGTVLDIAKLMVFGDEYDVQGVYDTGAALVKKCTLVLIPTTCGTGSEATNVAIVAFKKKGTKFGLAVPQLYADEAVLIPSMLATLPYEVFATSSIDALIHAVESYVSPKASDFTRALGASAIEKILKGYQKVAAAGERKLPEDMTDFLTASTMAGIAFGNAGCAAVHALSYPIGTLYHVPHGKANYMVFNEVFAEYRAKNADLSPLVTVLCRVLGCDEAAVWDELFSLIDKILDCPTLTSLGVDEKICGEMAESVIQNQQRLLVNNPVELSTEEVKQIYVRCL